jgi:hypothetical protein
MKLERGFLTGQTTTVRNYFDNLQLHKEKQFGQLSQQVKNERAPKSQLVKNTEQIIWVQVLRSTGFCLTIQN